MRKIVLSLGMFILLAMACAAEPAFAPSIETIDLGDFKMRIAAPDTGIDFKLLVVEPDPSKRFTMIVVDPRTGRELRLALPRLKVIPFGLDRREGG